MDSDFIDKRIATSRMILQRYVTMALRPVRPSFSKALFESEIDYLSSLVQMSPDRRDEIDELIAAWSKLAEATKAGSH